jgi:hypothetical protein
MVGEVPYYSINMNISVRGVKLSRKLTPSRPSFEHPVSFYGIKLICWWDLGVKCACLGFGGSIHEHFVLKSRLKTSCRPAGSSISAKSYRCQVIQHLFA